MLILRIPHSESLLALELVLVLVEDVDALCLPLIGDGSKQEFMRGKIVIGNRSKTGHVRISLNMASTPPLIFKRTKSKPAQRARETSTENVTDDTVSATGDDSPSTLASKLRNRVKKARPKSRLSFGGEEEVCVVIA